MSKIEKPIKKYKVTYGGWYQRTTLHLSEVYELMALGRSRLKDLSKEKLREFRRLMDLKKVTREAEYLEFVKGEANNGIEIRYYEDGLYVLEIETTDIKEGQGLLEDYFNRIFQPAIAYIFSLGAPVPKVLANIETVHPTVIGLPLKDPAAFKPNIEDFGEVYSKISSNDITVYKTPGYIFVITSTRPKALAADLVRMQIFFREFKDQLEKYLEIHRSIWEKISAIKEKRFIRGKEVNQVRRKLDSYQKTISLISNRINQMGSYVRTRASIASKLKIESDLSALFQYKFEVLTNTLTYIKEIWRMTGDYLAAAIKIIVEIENRTTNISIRSLQVITTVGVISGILGYLGRSELPKMDATGVLFFALLVFSTWLINMIISRAYRARKYRLGFTERVFDI